MSNKRHKYFNKVPPFKPDPEHYTRKHHSWKAKEAYETEDDAWEYLNQNPKVDRGFARNMVNGYPIASNVPTIFAKCADTFHQMCRHLEK